MAARWRSEGGPAPLDELEVDGQRAIPRSLMCCACREGTNRSSSSVRRRDRKHARGKTDARLAVRWAFAPRTCVLRGAVFFPGAERAWIAPGRGSGGGFGGGRSPASSQSSLRLPNAESVQHSKVNFRGPPVMTCYAVSDFCYSLPHKRASAAMVVAEKSRRPIQILSLRSANRPRASGMSDDVRSRRLCPRRSRFGAQTADRLSAGERCDRERQP